MYQYDPDARPDSEFAPGELRWLVTGNTGRLLDGRRTPVRVTALDLAHGYFEAEILAFEDAGARWLVPLEDVTRYQFAPGGRRGCTGRPGWPGREWLCPGNRTGQARPARSGARGPGRRTPGC